MGSAKSNKQKKGSILPLLVFVIIGFLVYKANPEYWQQGKLLQDWQKLSQKEAATEDVANIPDKPVEKKPEVDPDAMLEGSVRGAKTIPINVLKMVHQNDTTYWTFRSKFITLYMAAPDNASSKKVIEDIREGIEKAGLKDQYTVTYMPYTSADKKKKCSVSKPQEFLCEECDRKICIIHPRKREFIVVAPTAQAALGRVRGLAKEGW